MALAGVRERVDLAPAVGVTVTFVFTVVFAILPEAVPLEQIKNAVFRATGVWLYGNPFGGLRFLGGVVGGFATGLALDQPWDEGLPVILKSVLAGLAVAYLVYVAITAVLAFAAYAMVPIASILFVPLVLALPLAAVYLLGGFVGGFAGLWVRSQVAA